MTTKIFSHTRKYIIRGLLAIIPIGLTYFVVRFFYIFIDKRMTGLIEGVIHFSIPGLGILLTLILLYVLGIIASNVAGRQLFHFLEKVTNRIPIIKTTYQIGKQLSNTFELPEKQVFKRAVLVDFLKPGIWVVGFVTGAVIDIQNENRKLLKVFVPTPPMPTSGTMVLVRESDIRDPGWTIEEAMKVVISGGIIGPEEIR